MKNIMVSSSPPLFLDLLKEVLDEDEKADRERHSEFRHYPSSASYKSASGEVSGACLRQLFWRATKEPESDHRDLSKKLQALFGNAIHDGLLKKLQKSKQIKIVPEAAGRLLVDPLTREISFRLDGLVTHRGDEGGLEIKTMQSYGLTRMIKDGGPKPGHLLQVTNYFGTNPRIRWFSLLYVGRDSGFRAEYHVLLRDGGLFVRGVFPETKEKEIPFNFDGIVARWKELETYVESNKLPPRDYKAVLDKEGKFTDKRTKNKVEYKSDWTCNYCDYKTKCWSLSDAKEYSYKLIGE